MSRLSLVLLVLGAVAALAKATPRRLQTTQIPNACYTTTLGKTKYHIALSVSTGTTGLDDAWCISKSKYQKNRSQRVTRERRLQTWGINNCWGPVNGPFDFYGPDKEGYTHSCPSVISATADLNNNYWCVPCRKESSDLKRRLLTKNH
jgi:hypothetical protein